MCAVQWWPRSGNRIIYCPSDQTDIISLMQVFGRKPIMIWSLLIFAVGSALCGAATTLNFLIAGRGIHSTWLRGSVISNILWWQLFRGSEAEESLR